MEEITVILNGYKRPEYLSEQLEAIKSQSMKPKEIWLWVNKVDGIQFPDKIEGIDVIVKSSKNFKYHGRFSLGLLATTKYLAFFDDDTIPGKEWFKNCLDTLKEYPKSILGGAGVTLLSNLYVTHKRVGWPSPSDNTQETDLVGHAWFFEREILNHLWSRVPPSLDNGEDIQLSFNAWLDSGIITRCPPHPENNKSLWSSLKAWEYGNDSRASSNGSIMPIPEFYSQRDRLLEYYLKEGYKPVLCRR